MKKTMRMWLFASALILGVASMVSCGNKTAKKAQTETSAQSDVVVEEKATCSTAIEDYLVNEFGKEYSQGDVCIPYAYVITSDDSNPDDILVWGDFWVFNYGVSGDTLKTVSGGDHPGLMHLKKTENGYEVTSFDAVADGAENLPSAQRIFGENYDAFAEFIGDSEKRESLRMRATAEYLKKHNMAATMLQDFGWPAVALPK